MRPPKLKWQKTVTAFEAMFAAVLGSADPRTHAQLVLAAREALADLKQHVNDSEECEQD